MHREVTEYRAVTGVCACGQVHRSAFPDALRAPVHYGPGLSALAVYLTDYQHLPYRCSAELIGVLADITLSPAILVNMGRKAAARLRTHRDEVMRFVTDRRVPFDNTQAYVERHISLVVVSNRRYEAFIALAVAWDMARNGNTTCGVTDTVTARVKTATSFGTQRPQHFLNLTPLPQGQGSLRPTFGPSRSKVSPK